MKLLEEAKVLLEHTTPINSDAGFEKAKAMAMIVLAEHIGRLVDVLESLKWKLRD